MRVFRCGPFDGRSVAGSAALLCPARESGGSGSGGGGSIMTSKHKRKCFIQVPRSLLCVSFLYLYGNEREEEDSEERRMGGRSDQHPPLPEDQTFVVVRDGERGEHKFITKSIIKCCCSSYSHSAKRYQNVSSGIANR